MKFLILNKVWILCILNRYNWGEIFIKNEIINWVKVDELFIDKDFCCDNDIIYFMNIYLYNVLNFVF